MAGFEVGIINIIADNLRDRYKNGFPVLKEIIQNADDAASQVGRDVQLDFGFTQGLHDAEHSLLQGPAIFFLNNGSFSEHDARAVKSFGLNSKAAHNSAIGKFGLGMKSVFHFCEAFFWLAEDGDLKKKEILNPWVRSDGYTVPQSVWDDPSVEDANKIKIHLKEVFKNIGKKYASYFLLWIPLRRQKHLDDLPAEKVGSIISEFPGDNLERVKFLFESDQQKEIAALLPLLRHLTHIQCWRQSKSETLDMQYSIQLQKNAHRSKFPDTKKLSPLSGVVKYGQNHNNSMQYALKFAGYEGYEGEIKLKQLRNSEHWPRSYVRDENGIESPAPDKAKGHCAVTFSRSSKETKGSLDIQWAVFLPVDSNRGEKCPCKSNFTYTLTLHGFFFIDAGRNIIEGLGANKTDIVFPPQSENDLRIAWNYYLSTRGTFRLIIRALEEFVNKARIGVEEVKNICSALISSNLFKSHRHHICKSSQWVLQITQTRSIWKRIESEKKIIPLPSPPQKNTNRPWETFPHLSDLEDEFIFVQKDAPHLALIENPQWDEQNLLRVFNFDAEKIFSSLGLINYLKLFLQDNSVSPFLGILEIQKRLKILVQEGFCHLGSKMSQVTAGVQEIVFFVLPEYRYIIKSDAHNVIKKLQVLESDFLILHKDFDSPKCPGTANLTADEGVQILQNLDEQLKEYEIKGKKQDAEKCREVIFEILKNLDNDTRNEVLARGRNLKIITAYDCQLKRNSSFTIEELKRYRNKASLFLYSPMNLSDRLGHGLSSKLQSVLVEDKVLLLKSRIAEIIFGTDKGGINQCVASTCLDALGHTYKALADEQIRADLIGSVSGVDLENSGVNSIRGFRYLLHGQKHLFSGKATLWVERYQQNQIWAKLWKQLSGYDENNVLVSRSLAEKIPQDRWEFLGLHEIDQQGILDDIRKKGTDFIQSAALSDEERLEVLLAARYDQELWKSLPLHKTVTGDFVSIDDSTYLEPSFFFPDELTDSINIIKIIKKSSNSDLHMIQKNADFIKPLTDSIFIYNVLNLSGPHNYFPFILDALFRINKEIKNEFREQLQNTKWLVDIDNTPLCPADVISLPDIKEEVDKLIGAEPGSYWQPESLSEKICQHPSFTQLAKNFFSHDENGLEQLALLLEQNSDYAIGRLSVNSKDFSSMLNVLGKSSFNQHLPGWRILQAVNDNFGQDKCQEHVLPAVLKSISNEKLFRLFEWLEQQYNGADDPNKQEVLLCHWRYLEFFLNLPNAGTLLKNIKLLNQLGKWCMPEELCADVEGVSPLFLLDNQQRQILVSLLPRQEMRPAETTEDTGEGHNNTIPEKRDLEPEIRLTIEHLSAYLNQWEGSVQPEAICGFLSILGNDPEMLQLAKLFQGRRSVEGIRAKVPWQVPKYIDSDGRKDWLYDLTFSQALSKFRFIVELVSGNEIIVTSLTGEEISVGLNDDFSSLLVGRPIHEWPEGGIYFVKIRLRKVKNEQVNPEQFSRYLKATAEYLLKVIYTQQNCDLTSLWDELNESEQLDVNIALRLVMKHIPFYLDQLGTHKHELLRPVYNSWNDARYKTEEYRDIPEKLKQYQEEEEKSRLDLQSLLETNPDVQKVVLESVRNKMRDFQYTEKSIPFELYQNADDAVVEQLEIEAVQEPLSDSQASHFVVQQEGGTIRFMHWGRPVNSTGSGGFPGRERGFHQDLEKMLILSSSNKTINNDSNHRYQLTGKFGLGFKSVLLVSDAPRFVSGRLGVEIIAGFYPKQISDHNFYYKLLSQFSDDNRRAGTLIELILSKNINANILEQFNRLSGVLTVFSKRIRQIVLVRSDEPQERVEWLPDNVLATPETKLEKSSITLWKDNKKLQPVDALYFRCIEGGGLLVGLSAQGFMVLPGELPPIWIVSPTKEKGRLGFCINGKFEVDAGRARLAGDSGENKKEAQRIGYCVGKALCLLFKKTTADWPAIREQFCLNPGLAHYKFWESVWDTLTKSWLEPSEKQLDSEVSDVVNNLLGKNSGLGMLIKEDQALPNGLWGEKFQRLIKPRSIRYVLRGSLSEKEVFMPLTKWQLFINRIDPGEVISAKILPALGKILPGFTQKKDQWESLRLSQALNWLKDDQYHVDTETASVFGEVLSKELLDNLQLTDDGKKEFENITAQLKQLKFQTQDGSWHKSRYLLRTFLLATDDDEPLRASFAPLTNVLLSSYTGIALDFFIICRGEMQAKAATMADWILQAVDDNQKAEALKYLIKGELGDRVATHLRSKGIDDCWLRKLTSKSPYYDGWTEDEIKELLFRKLPALSDLEKWQEEDNYYEQETKVTPPGDVSKTLHNIYNWWQNNKSEYLQKYEKQTYPDYSTHNSLAEDDRSAWLTILMIGSFHTFGRARPEQHRGFLSLCQKKGWWNIFIQEHPKKYPDKWMGILEEYIDNQIEDSKFEYWMRLFPTIYKFAREIENYIELFYGLETQGKNIDIQQTMAPNTFSNFQGGGITAAPIAKTLGMGVPFVLREMMRKGLFNSNKKYIAPYCYVPLGRVRNFFSKMGCNDLENGESHITKSKIIYDFLCNHLGDEKAGFDNAFDIPFQYVAEDLELQKELFA